jgi:hypothetical protein
MSVELQQRITERVEIFYSRFLSPQVIFFYYLQVFEETVEVCKQPLVKTCNNETVGEEVCSTHYETNCETRLER